MSLEILRSNFHSHFLNVRNIEVLVAGDNFTIAYANSTRKEKSEVEDAIAGLNISYLKEFVRKHLKRLSPFYRMSVRELRKIAAKEGISHYWSLSKQSLIEEIEDVVKRLKEGS